MLNKVIIHCDGASRGNPGKASIGVAIFDDNMNILKKHNQYLGIKTNNAAEYSSLIAALKLAKEFTDNEVDVFMDSELVIKQMKGIYRVKDRNLQKLFSEVKLCEKYFKKINYKNVPREDKYQKIVDSLANQALDEL